MNVSAIIVTRGDVDVQPILESLPQDWEKLVWSNGSERRTWALTRFPEGQPIPAGACGPRKEESYEVPVEMRRDLAVYGRYAAIEYASHDLIYVQDDDCIVSDPQAIVEEWERQAAVRQAPVRQAAVGLASARQGSLGSGKVWAGLVANMPLQFRHPFYSDNCLVGFGAAFHRDLPDEAFSLMVGADDIDPPFFTEGWGDEFHRTCDIAFTALTPRVLVDIPVENLPWATDLNRMYHQPEHVQERTRMLELVRQVKGAT